MTKEGKFYHYTCEYIAKRKAESEKKEGVEDERRDQ